MKGIRFLQIAGVDVRIHPLLPVVAAFAAWLGYGRALWMAAACLTVHEVAHVCAARARGVDVEWLTLTPFGGIAKMDALLEMRPGAEIAVALSGPMSNLLCAIVIIALRDWFSWPVRVCAPWVETHLSICLINLVPALPMDGGRALRALLARRFGAHIATRVAAGLGCGVGLSLIAMAVIVTAQGAFPLTLASVALCIFLSACAEWRNTPYTAMRALGHRAAALRRDRVIPIRHLAAMRSETLFSVSQRFRPHRYHMVTALSENGDALYSVDERTIVEGVLSGHGNTCIGALTLPFNNDTFLN